MDVYKSKADKLNLSKDRYWQLLLHMESGESEIDDKEFFFSKDGQYNAKAELDATLDAFFNETRFDDNSSACRFPARKAWLQEHLDIDALPDVNCSAYDKTLKRLDPKSVTLVFPSAHINSPASMFGHTFLRINSSYNSRLLSYAINYAANANPDDTNALVFGVKGLVGGYNGQYSLLPYYEKLKEYRDTEQRDIWEYDLDLKEEEVLKMVRHIWELQGTKSSYYFFTQNCSYNMLWLIELARPSIHLREYFHYEVIPLETVHAAISENIVVESHFRPSKRALLLEYENLIDEKYLPLVKSIVSSKMELKEILSREDIPIQQKQYILEASTEYLEYYFSKNDMSKDDYIELFHRLSKERASLGQGKKLNIKTPNNPADGHRAIRTTLSAGIRDEKAISFIDFRFAYHDLEDSSYGFLRGTQIEFLNLELSYSEDKIELEKGTIFSIVSLVQQSEFFNTFSWRTKFGWDRNYLDEKSSFIGTVGAGYSFGNESAYTYFMIDPLFYLSDGFHAGVGGSVGFVFDKYDFMSTNIELTRRYYNSKEPQNLVKISQSFRLSQNFQLKINYDYKDRKVLDIKGDEQTYRVSLSYYF